MRLVMPEGSFFYVYYAWYFTVSMQFFIQIHFIKVHQLLHPVTLNHFNRQGYTYLLPTLIQKNIIVFVFLMCLDRFLRKYLLRIFQVICRLNNNNYNVCVSATFERQDSEVLVELECDKNMDNLPIKSLSFRYKDEKRKYSYITYL